MTDKLVVVELQTDGAFECMQGVELPATVAAIQVSGSNGVCVPFTEIWRITDNPITKEDKEFGEPGFRPAIGGEMLYFSVQLGEAIIREGRDHD